MKRLYVLTALLLATLAILSQDVKVLGIEARKFGISMAGASIETSVALQYSGIENECYCAVILGNEKWDMPKTPEDVAELFQSGVSVAEQELPLSKDEVKGELPVSVPVNTSGWRRGRGGTTVYAQAIVLDFGKSEDDELKLLAKGDIIAIDLNKLQRPDIARPEAKDRGNLAGVDIVGEAIKERISGSSDSGGKRVQCSQCNGSGVCSVCSGHDSSCQRCGGTGKCHYCGGGGSRAVAPEEQKAQQYLGGFMQMGIEGFMNRRRQDSQRKK